MVHAVDKWFAIKEGIEDYHAMPALTKNSIFFLFVHDENL